MSELHHQQQILQAPVLQYQRIDLVIPFLDGHLSSARSKFTIHQIMSAVPPLPPNVEEIAASPLLGGVFNWCLYGVLVVQTYVYSYNFPDDKRLVKCLVYGFFFLETLQTALTGADLYYWFASGFGNLDHLASPYLAFFDVPVIGSVVSLTVQFFFAYRIFVLSKRKALWLCAIIALCSIVGAGAAIGGGTYSRIRGKFATGLVLKMFLLTCMAGNTISDICIASAMIYYLTRQRGSDRDGFFSRHALERIVRLTVETNIITTTVSVISLVMAALYPDTNWFVCPTSILGKVYSNTLLVSFNNRISIRERLASVRASQNPVTSFSTHEEVTMDVIVMDMQMSPQDLKINPLGELECQRRIINFA
ncbi:hypothetical protein F5148DRAFT_1378708 [Russula earlei]|uniref:Uncharacterized protein n=1 Tax=Russula earlei TaxID=71964 RepID=A0ACC0TXI5_9AGAM|nr:hypothetical protein F5148DRAFT_1378708 [Russula earlei]